MEPFSNRGQLANQPLTQAVFELMRDKQSNLALAADVTDSETLVDIADKAGPSICVLKTHIDIVNDFSPRLIDKLTRLADKHRFFIFEDRKFADIGHTVQLQYAHGIYRIASWAHFINAHVISGPGIIESLKSVSEGELTGLLLIADMSSQGNLFDKRYRDKVSQMAHDHNDFVTGFITRHRIQGHQDQLTMMPGVRMAEGQDRFDQQYLTPERAVLNHGADVIIVGRGVLTGANWRHAAESYRQAGWRAYLSSLDG